MQKRSLLVQVLLDMATGGATLEELVVDRAGTFDGGVNKGYNPIVVPSGSVNVYGEKGVVSNHSVVVTPKGQLTSGWVDGGSVDGAGVGVTAGELVDGTYNVSQAGSADVTNYKDVSVKSGGTTSSIDRTTVDAHTVRLTPKATVTEGWQGSGTVTGESVDVNAGELVSGTYPVTESGEFDVSAYEKISVPSGSVGVNAVKGMVANHSVLVTPSGSRSAGFISSGTTQGQAVRVDASELVSGTLNVTNSGVQDVSNYENISVPSGGHSASATKGAVSNHSVSVTPKSTATAGFVSAGEVNGTPVSVSASELVSGTLNVSQSGTQDVTNYKNVSVPSGGHSASATKGQVSNHSVVVTPRSTATQGFVQAGTVNGSGVTVNASELVSGRLAVTQNGIIDVTNYKEIEVQGIMTKDLIASSVSENLYSLNGTTTLPTWTFDASVMKNYSAFLLEGIARPNSAEQYSYGFALNSQSYISNFIACSNYPLWYAQNCSGETTASMLIIPGNIVSNGIQCKGIRENSVDGSGIYTGGSLYALAYKGGSTSVNFSGSLGIYLYGLKF